MRKRPGILPLVQLGDLQRRSPYAGGGTVRRDTLSWRYSVRPSPIAREYCLDLILAPTDTPKVFVRHPRLVELSDGESPPHMYDHARGQICLYLPRQNEWKRTDWLAETIIPWSGMWLAYFEDWLTTGEWLGGGEHPKPMKKV